MREPSARTVKPSSNTTPLILDVDDFKVFFGVYLCGFWNFNVMCHWCHWWYFECGSWCRAISRSMLCLGIWWTSFFPLSEGRMLIRPRGSRCRMGTFGFSLMPGKENKGLGFRYFRMWMPCSHFSKIPAGNWSICDRRFFVISHSLLLQPFMKY